MVVTDLTKEHPNKTLWRFLLPMMLSVMFQQIYNIADSMIAGKFAGEDALAAVGASYPITVIFMAFAVGMNLGTSVIVSRLFGAGDRKGVRRAVTTAFVASGALGIALTLFGCMACRSMMLWIRTPENRSRFSWLRRQKLAARTTFWRRKRKTATVMRIF